MKSPILFKPAASITPVSPAVKSTGSSTLTADGRELTEAEASELAYLQAQGRRVGEEVAAYLAAEKAAQKAKA